jgi:hypothetical protein
MTFGKVLRLSPTMLCLACVRCRSGSPLHFRGITTAPRLARDTLMNLDNFDWNMVFIFNMVKTSPNF